MSRKISWNRAFHRGAGPELFNDIDCDTVAPNPPPAAGTTADMILRGSDA
jgi:hypothetical protein